MHGKSALQHIDCKQYVYHQLDLFIWPIPDFASFPKWIMSEKEDWMHVCNSGIHFVKMGFWLWASGKLCGLQNTEITLH